MGSKQLEWQLTQDSGTCYALPKGLIFIGCEACDIVLQYPGIEKRHAVISYNADHGEFYIKDLNSLTGTYVNGARIAEQLYIKLSLKDNIRLGYGPIFTLTQVENSPSPSKEQQNINSVKNGQSALKEQYGVFESERKFSPLKEQKQYIIGLDKSQIKEDQQDLLKLEETNLHDSLEDICEIPSHSSEILSDSSPVVTNNSNEMLKEVKSPTRVMPFPSSPMRSPQSFDNNFSDISIVNRSPIHSPHRDKSAFLVNSGNHNTNSNSNNTTSESSLQEGLSSGSSAGRTPENAQPSSMAFTIPFDLDVPKRKIRMKDGISRFSSSKSDSENGHSYRSPILSSRKDDRQLPEKMNGSSRGKHENLHEFNVVLQKYSKISVPELLSPTNGSFNGSSLNDSASYLIHKMLGGESADDVVYGVSKHPSSLQQNSRQLVLDRRRTSPTSSNDKHSPEYSRHQSPLSPIKPISRERDADEKSETGTYTVETDQTDPDVEEARKKIDEVFGVYKPNNKVLPRQSSKENNGTSLVQHRSHTGSDASDRDSGSSREPIPATRPKRRLPTPPVEKVNLNFDVGNTRESTYGKRSETFVQDQPAAKPPLPNSCFLVQSCVPKPPPRFYQSKSHAEQRGEQAPIYGRPDQRLVHRQSSAGTHPDSVMCGSLSDSGSGRRFFGSPWQRMSWNRSCSDLELDQSKSDSASVVSDLSTSTEPSSHSSGRNKNEVGPQMRLNRAFALRRARLGFETDDLQPASRVMNRDTKQMPRSGNQSSPNSLSRQDGGRFSLRLPRSTTVRLSKVNNKSQDTKVSRQPQTWSNVAPAKPIEAKEPITDEQGASQKAKREVSALDSLVISAIYQLSSKLKTGASALLEKERQKYPERSDSRLMIDELLPQIGDRKSSEMSAEGNLTRDLSSILRNLKRVEQVLEVMTVLGEHAGPGKDGNTRRPEKSGFFIVDV